MYVLCIYVLITDMLSFSFFFFKQKTAYEMRISDWSSDVCSSDLRPLRAGPRAQGRHGRLSRGPARKGRAKDTRRPDRLQQGAPGGAALVRPVAVRAGRDQGRAGRSRLSQGESQRSEEHTSELQSLMRISYAVFCLKKKQIQTTKNQHTA